jgi:BirA family transcriptional regulator, biotin operon repressor / biotin---[acetyl-CoA-carboxylase] ligase
MTDSRVDDAFDWPFVKTTLVYDVIDSTSDQAAQLVREGRTQLPLVVWARRQTRGRGRGSHEWWSDGGSLTLTLAIDPAGHGLRAEIEPRLALATAVAVIEALDDLTVGHPSIGIRWPNDLEAVGRKLGGILPERVETAAGRRILIGIGLNVWTELTHAPLEVSVMATSLAALAGRAYDEVMLHRLIPEILRRFGAVLKRLVAGDPSLADQWRRLDLLRDIWVRVDCGTRLVCGLAHGIDADGSLCVIEGSEERRIVGGQVLRDPLILRPHPTKQA